MKSLFSPRRLWLGVNVLGIAIYLYLASALWVRPGEEGTPGGAGDAFYWLGILVPILSGFVVLNVTVLTVIVLRLKALRRRVALAFWFAVAFLWAGAVVVDHVRAFREIDAKYA